MSQRRRSSAQILNCCCCCWFGLALFSFSLGRPSGPRINPYLIMRTEQRWIAFVSLSLLVKSLKRTIITMVSLFDAPQFQRKRCCCCSRFLGLVLILNILFWIYLYLGYMYTHAYAGRSAGTDGVQRRNEMPNLPAGKSY